MQKYLLDTVVTYRVSTVEDVKKLHAEMQQNKLYSIVAFSYKTKEVKEKGEVVDEYQVVTAKLSVNVEKDPENGNVDMYISISNPEEGEGEW